MQKLKEFTTLECLHDISHANTKFFEIDKIEHHQANSKKEFAH